MDDRRKSLTKSERYRTQFEQEALPFLGAVHNFALNLSKNAIVAEDLTQDTFLHAFRGFGNFKIGTSCKAWLFKICRNLFIDRLRKHTRMPRRTAIDTVELESFDAEADLRALERLDFSAEEIVDDLFGDEVQHHLEELPEDFRRALLLCDLEGFSYKEITEIMGTPLGTVRSRISRARDFLRTRLQAYAAELGFGEKHPSHGELCPCGAC